jgi:hypothetical protein
VTYKIGRSCSGQPILVKITSRSGSFKYYTPGLEEFTHQMRGYHAQYNAFSVDHTSTNGAYYPNAQCYGNCTIVVGTPTDVLMEYNAYSNLVYFACFACLPLQQGDANFHYFLSGVITRSKR